MNQPFVMTCAVLLACATGAARAQVPPTCRFDEEGARAAAAITRSAMQAYAALGKPLPFDDVIANPVGGTTSAKSLAVYVVKDATKSAVGRDGCPTSAALLVKDEELDGFSVRGGCVAGARAKEVRCSSGAVQIFGKQGTRPGLANPALLYVLAHELGHLLQRRPGEYAGRVEPIDLSKPRNAKLEMLRESCEPGMTKAEEDADRLAVQVLAKLLPEPPYRESLFSPRGSILWGADQLNLAANTWRKASLEREFISQATPHKSFLATEFPMPQVRVQANARKFVCDVLTGKTGVVNYPGRAATHPVLEVRMQKVAEALRAVASDLPKAGAQQEYQPVAVLQEQLSDIFTFMYRENGRYLQAVQSAICTRVNSDKPTSGCAGS